MAYHRGAYDQDYVEKCVRFYAAHPEILNQDIAKKFDVSSTALRRWCITAGVHRHLCKRIVDWDEIAPYLETMRISDIVKKFKVGYTSVSLKRKELGITDRQVARRMAVPNADPIAGPYVTLWDNWKRPIDLPKYYRHEPC